MPTTVPHLRPSYLGVVLVGGALGTGLRILAGQVIHPGAWPWATLLVNLVGAFVLGWLTEHTLLRAPRAGGLLRALFGTGLCGGLTTYSTLAVDTVRLGGHAPGSAFAYLVVTLGLGIVCAGLGVAAGKGRA